MKSYLSLIPISAKAHKQQNKLTLLCIALSVFLVTAVFSMAETGIRMEADRLAAKHDDFSITALLNTTMGQTLIIVAVFLSVLILIAGVLMISGSINSSVAQRTRFFGLMRCIGMSKRQVSRYVRLEALNWCKSAIPAGLAAGIVFTWIVCALLRYIVGEEFTEIKIFFISIPGLICGTAVGLVTVLLAASSPAKKAADVSPAAAVSGGTDTQKYRPKKNDPGILRIETRLGIYHAAGSKKNLILIAGSFALSIILFLSFLVLTDLVDYLLPQNHNDADIEISSQSDMTLGSGLIGEIAEIHGVKRVFGRRSALDLSAAVNGSASVIDLIAFDDFDLGCLEKDHMVRQGSKPEKVFGNSSYVIAAWDKNSPLRIGDRITIGNEIFEIAGLLKFDPFSSDGMTGGRVTLISSGETFIRLTGESGYRLISVQTSKDITDDDIDKIHDIVGNSGTVMDRRDLRTFGTYMAFMMLVYGFLALIALVSLINIINSISMSVSARSKQYGAMRAVGMSIDQVTKMIASEALTYAVSGFVPGCIIGLIIHKTLYRILIEDHFPYASWRIPVLPLVIVVLFILGAAALAVIPPAVRLRRMAITETISEL